ncbi:uncharacterized protein V1513DRAFT_455940 [Lipomyces chichibuensis]|uniref:uncharacterized protein n=1 Tax=Lipomyces chichibuensis TaxID=1546026 RepID=UPI00334345F1
MVLNKCPPADEDSEALSNYNKPFELLKENPAEQRLDVQLPFEKYLQLDDPFSDLKSAAGISEDEVTRYPSLTYNTHTQTVTVVTAPSSIHEEKSYLSTRSPQTLQNIRLLGSTTKYSTGGKVVVVVGVGRSEAYDKLLNDKDIWINDDGVNIVILVCFNESPPFKYPATALYRDITDRQAQQASMSHAVREATQLNIQQDCYGPLLYRDHTSVGMLKEAYIEVWRQDSHERFLYILIQEGFPVGHDDLPVTLGLGISDLYPFDAWQAADIEDCTIPLDSASFLEALRHDIVGAANNRFKTRFFAVDKLRLEPIQDV